MSRGCRQAFFWCRGRTKLLSDRPVKAQIGTVWFSCLGDAITLSQMRSAWNHACVGALPLRDSLSTQPWAAADRGGRTFSPRPWEDATATMTNAPVGDLTNKDSSSTGLSPTLSLLRANKMRPRILKEPSLTRKAASSHEVECHGTLNLAATTTRQSGARRGGKPRVVKSVEREFEEVRRLGEKIRMISRTDHAGCLAVQLTDGWGRR